jgi:hypothetical protein
MTVAEGGGIFVSYRRQESRDFAGRLSDRLTDRFGKAQVFIDVDAIDPGVDFVEAITRAVAACNVLLAIIGPTWLTTTDKLGRRRLDDPDDIVRLEIEAALARDVQVIPILADGAVMPGRQDLPESLAGLARLNALLIRHESFHQGAERLVTAIEQVLAAASGTGQSPPTANADETAPPTANADETAQRSSRVVRNDQYEQAKRVGGLGRNQKHPKAVRNDQGGVPLRLLLTDAERLVRDVGQPEEDTPREADEDG